MYEMRNVVGWMHLATSTHYFPLAYTSFFAIFEFASSHDGRKFVNTCWIRFIAQIGFHHIKSQVANLYAGGGKG